MSPVGAMCTWRVLSEGHVRSARSLSRSVATPNMPRALLRGHRSAALQESAVALIANRTGGVKHNAMKRTVTPGWAVQRERHGDNQPTDNWPALWSKSEAQMLALPCLVSSARSRPPVAPSRRQLLGGPVRNCLLDYSTSRCPSADYLQLRSLPNCQCSTIVLSVRFSPRDTLAAQACRRAATGSKRVSRI
jgi:hypothetical protein